MKIGNFIKKLREDNGLTQTQIGEIAGVSNKTVSTWENNIKLPRMGAIERLASYFKIRKSDFFSDDENAPLDYESKERALLEKHLIEIVNTLDDEGLKKLSIIIKIMEIPEMDFDKLVQIAEIVLQRKII